VVTSYTLDLFRDPFFIGFNQMANRLNQIHSTATHQSYPPYDVEEVKENSLYLVTLAVAGFSKDDISVSVDNGTLVVKGEREADEASNHILHKGIAARKFTRTFALGEYMEVTGAELKDGLLKISVEKIIPEEKKPKTIKIK
jgi:molecular chaperone IbpA